MKGRNQDFVSRCSKAALTYRHRSTLKACSSTPINERIFSDASDENRADWWVLLPLSRKTNILCLEPPFCSQALSLARIAKSVVVCGTISEALSSVQMRAKEERIKNLLCVHISNLDVNLPFKAGYFDLVVLNSFLQNLSWISNKTELNSLHRKMLLEVRRLIKPQGYVYMGARNKLGFTFLTRKPKKGISLLTALCKHCVKTSPQKMYQNLYNRKNLYSYWSYKKLLQTCAYHPIAFFLPFRSYLQPNFIVAFDDKRSLKYLMNSRWRKDELTSISERLFHLLLDILLSSGILRIARYFTNGYIIIGKKYDT